MAGIRDFQNLMRTIYFERDRERGVAITYAWLVSEVGELARALIRGSKPLISEEVADVLAWLLSLCNLLGIDAEKAAYEKYGKGCPRCGSIPCVCRTRKPGNF